MIVPFLVIYIFNFIVFGLVFVSLLHKTYHNKRTSAAKATDANSSSSFLRQQLVIVFTLSVLFGLGWGIGLLATQDAHNNKHVRDLFSALFVLITAFHGLFIFIMNGVRSKDVRTVWKQWFNQVTRQHFDHMTRSSTSAFGHRNTASTTNPATFSLRHISEGGTFKLGSTTENQYESGTLKYFTSKQRRNNDADDPFENEEWEKERSKEMEAMEEAPVSVSGFDDSEMQQRARKEKEIEEMKESGMH